MPRDTNAKTLGSVYDQVKQAKVLMVGAGGIGCELLKDLVLLGFKEIHVVDLDTIDLSNLNRQFLFGHEHIKKSKALVAKEVASKFNPNVKIVAHHDNIKDTSFNVNWFKQFDIVYNALDNMDARRHVNKVCLAANVPLIESGTTGFQGQVQVIVGGKTECYDCTGKLVPKSFPVCTIRSTPSQPVHNVVWAKSYLFAQLFDEEAEESLEEAFEDDAEADNDDRENMQREVNELKELKKSILDNDAFEKIVNRIFDADIERLVGMESMWKTRKPPTPLKYNKFAAAVGQLNGDELEKDDQKVWTIEQNLAVLKSSLKRLQERVNSSSSTSQSSNSRTTILFDKDDEDTLAFVVAAANIRSNLFGIDVKSKFEIKQIAGNIIPAVATINAIVAGVCVLQSLKVLQGKLEEAKLVFISQQRDRIFTNAELRPPNPYCVVSGVDRATLEADPASFTLGELVAKLEEIQFSNEISIITDKLLYDPDFDDNAGKTLSELGITNGSFITAVDEDDDGTNHVNLELNIISSENGKGTQITNVPEKFKTKPPKQASAPVEPSEPDVAELSVPGSAQKRKHEGEVNGDVKRAKIESNGVSDAVAVEDEGIVVIDDDDDVIEID